MFNWKSAFELQLGYERQANLTEEAFKYVFTVSELQVARDMFFQLCLIHIFEVLNEVPIGRLNTLTSLQEGIGLILNIVSLRLCMGSTSCFSRDWKGTFLWRWSSVVDEKFLGVCVHKFGCGLGSRPLTCFWLCPRCWWCSSRMLHICLFWASCVFFLFFFSKDISLVFLKLASNLNLEFVDLLLSCEYELR